MEQVNRNQINKPEDLNFSVALIHHPVLDRAKNVVATNITNFDIHDIARACRTYGVKNYFIVHPHDEQLMFVSRVLDHWRVGEGSRLNPMRQTALTDVRLAKSIDAVVTEISKTSSVKNLKIVATSAKDSLGISPVSFKGLRSEAGEAKAHYLLLFGTGFGLTEDVLGRADYLLGPIKGSSHDDYRHLSVRSAVSIILDRLMGL